MEFLTFLLRSSIVLVLFYVVYQLFLRNDAHYSINRWFLIVGLLMSIMLPFIQINYTVLVEGISQRSAFIPVKAQAGVGGQVQSVVEPEFSWKSILPYFYISVSVLFIVRITYNILKIFILAHAAYKIQRDGVIICVNSKIQTPFAIFNRIFVKDESYLSEENEQILVHEMVHLKEHHWLDVMLSELLIVVQWFNPLTWAYARIIKQNLEFIADKRVLNKGFRMDKYIQTIICETMGAEASVLANHFRFSQSKLGDGICRILPFMKSAMGDFSQNKRRLKMMKNDKKSKWRLFKLLMVLPLIGGLLWAFSEPVYEYKPNGENQTGVVYQGEKEVFRVKGIVRSDESPLPGTSIVIKGTTTGTVANMQGEFELEVSKGDAIVFSFVGFETVVYTVKNKEAIKVKLKKTTHELDPASYRTQYKGKMTPPPPPSKKVKETPPPPPPAKDGKPVFYVVEEMPQYKGGMETYYASLYTRIAQVKRDEKLGGTVKVEFTIDAKGILKDVHALNLTNKKEAKYAVKIVSELNDWKPGKQRGKAISTTMVVPVEFD